MAIELFRPGSSYKDPLGSAFKRYRLSTEQCEVHKYDGDLEELLEFVDENELTLSYNKKKFVVGGDYSGDRGWSLALGDYIVVKDNLLFTIDPLNYVFAVNEAGVPSFRYSNNENVMPKAVKWLQRWGAMDVNYSDFYGAYFFNDGDSETVDLSSNDVCMAYAVQQFEVFPKDYVEAFFKVVV